jgi:outer membrane cobalamin receptor
VSPRFSIVRGLSPGTDVRISWGRYYQSQGINELQVEDGIERFFPAQQSDAAIIGLQKTFRQNYSVRLEAYWKWLRHQRPRYENLFDPLAIIPEFEPDRVQVAADKALARGLEASIAYDGSGDMSWWASYALAEVTDRIAGRDVPRSWDQRHAIQFGVDWETERWDIAVATNIHSGWPRTPLSFDMVTNPSQPMIDVGQRNSERFGSFATLDFRVTYKARVRRGQLSYFLELSNATDRNNPCCIDFDLDTDASGNRVIDQKTDYWLPFLPAIGILWEF